MSDTPDAEAEAVAPDIRGGMLCIILAEAIRMFESKAEFLENARDLNKHDPDEHLVLDGRAKVTRELAEAAKKMLPNAGDAARGRSPAPTGAAGGLAERLKAEKIDPLDDSHPQHHDGSYMAGWNRALDAAARESERYAADVQQLIEAGNAMANAMVMEDLIDAAPRWCALVATLPAAGGEQATLPTEIVHGVTMTMPVVQKPLGGKLGCLDTIANEIQIEQDQPEPGKHIILLHELIHLVAEHLKQEGIIKRQPDEAFVTHLAGGLWPMLALSGLWNGPAKRDVLAFVEGGDGLVTGEGTVQR